jgi:uncharacterized phage-associated protein
VYEYACANAEEDKMVTYSADEVADTIIYLSRERGIEITNLKLQKLLYYSQAWYLAFTGEPLFGDSIEAWVHGPVVPSVFRRFRGYRWKPIDCDVKPIEDARIIAHINAVLDTYGSIQATRLESLTHREEPWRDARGERPIDEPSNEVISKADMKRFYAALLTPR